MSTQVVPDGTTDYVDAYAKAGLSDPLSDYGGYSYGAANLLIAALTPAVQDTDPASRLRCATRC